MIVIIQVPMVFCNEISGPGLQVLPSLRAAVPETTALTRCARRQLPEAPATVGGGCGRRKLVKGCKGYCTLLYHSKAKIGR